MQSGVKKVAKLIVEKPKPLVSIIIAGRNSEKFLDETIQSALLQPNSEIIYVDDCSYDFSISIAEKYKDRILIAPLYTHQGVCAARNHGASFATTPWLIFMDTDDTLSPTFVSDMLSDLTAHNSVSPPFIYPSTKCFGDSNTLWTNMPWADYDKWTQNQVTTTSMWNRSVFCAAGQWQDMRTMWDYDLALRCSRFGTPYAGRAILNYRIHDASQSAQLNERLRIKAIPHQEIIRRKNATLGIGSLVSGRLPGLFPKWLSKLSCSVRYSASQCCFGGQKVKLYLLFHNDAKDFIDDYKYEARKYSDTFDVFFDEIMFTMKKDTEFDRRHSVCNLLSTACQRIQDFLHTDLIWLIEDDICVPIEACDFLYHSVTQGAVPPIGVSGSYYNRHKEMMGKLLGGWIMDGVHCEPTTPFRPQDVVDFVGTGCLMYWPYRPGSPKKWRPISKIENATAHDWAWSEDVQGSLLVDGRVICDHHIDEEVFV